MYENYYEEDLAAFEGKLKDAGEHVQTLRKKMKDAKRNYLYLNSFATAQHELDLTILKLEACISQVNAGYHVVDKGKKIHQRAREKQAKKRSGM